MNRAFTPKPILASSNGLTVTRSEKKPKAKKITFHKKHLALAISTILGVATVSAFAGPEGGVVTGGSGSILNSGNTTTINQTTDRMAIDWNTFNVNSDERVDFR